MVLTVHHGARRHERLKLEGAQVARLIFLHEQLHRGVVHSAVGEHHEGTPGHPLKLGDRLKFLDAIRDGRLDENGDTALDDLEDILPLHAVGAEHNRIQLNVLAARSRHQVLHTAVAALLLNAPLFGCLAQSARRNIHDRGELEAIVAALKHRQVHRLRARPEPHNGNVNLRGHERNPSGRGGVHLAKRVPTPAGQPSDPHPLNTRARIRNCTSERLR